MTPDFSHCDPTRIESFTSSTNRTTSSDAVYQPVNPSIRLNDGSISKELVVKYSNETESLNSIKIVFSYLTASSELLVSKEVVLFTEYCNNTITTKEKSAIILEMNETDSFASNFRQLFLIAT